MKTIAVFYLMMIFTYGFADDGKYIEAMKKNIDVVYMAKTAQELQAAVNAFERIGAAEKTRWEPYYYASFGYIMMAISHQELSGKDAFLDQASNALSKAKELKPDDSEIVTLEGFVYTIRVSADPASRGPQYAPLAMQMFGKARALNPENPRALALMAQMQYGTAQFFGSPVTEACATLDLALTKFDSFKADNPIAPQWGRPMAEELKKQCY